MSLSLVSSAVSAAPAVSAVSSVVSSTPTTTYASNFNSRYLNKTSNFVSLADRINNTIASLSPQAQRNWHSSLKIAIRAFKKNYPLVKTFANRSLFPMCIAQDRSMAEILIDTTMQRELNLQWVLTIITNFRAYQASSICVYKTPSGQYGAWDCQHTAVALYLISFHALGIDPAITLVEVPCTIYDIKSRGQIRGVFISNNTHTGKNRGKMSLEKFDQMQQMIYGVKVDGVSDPEWQDVAEKHELIAAAGMFLTSADHGNVHQPGAISRMDEILNASVEVVRQFCVYGEFIVNSQNRPIDTKELPIIIEFLNMCEKSQLVYSDAEIRDLALHLINLPFNANFNHDGPYWDQVHRANVNAYNAVYNTAKTQLSQNLWPTAPKNNKNVPHGVTFLWHQLRRSWAATKGPKFKFPQATFITFVPDNKDLF